MGYITYKQADSRWGKLNYNGSSTMATAGCGPTAVAMLGYAVAGRSNPISCMKYMQKHGYAVRNHGTAWDGIPACMRACGLVDVKNVAKMSDVFAYLAKGYCAVFLTSYKYAKQNGASMDVVWTTDGHFVSITDYKKKGGKDYVYVRDPGGRNNTGWFCYQTQLRGWLPQVWVGKVPSKSAPKPAVKTNGEKIADKAKELAWPYGTSKEKYKYPSGSATAKFKEAIQKAYGDRKGWGKQTKAGASCDVFVGVVVRASGIDPTFPRGLDGVEKHCKNNSRWKLTGVKSESKMMAGDVIYQLYKGGGGHIFVYVGNGKIANAHYNGKTYGVIEKLSTTVSASKCSTYNVYRAK